MFSKAEGEKELEMYSLRYIVVWFAPRTKLEAIFNILLISQDRRRYQMAAATHYATGKRKYAIARAWVSAGAGDITVNTRPLEEYFPRPTLRTLILSPVEVTGMVGKCNVLATVSGGGTTGQAGALRHAIAKALIDLNPAFREALKKEGFLTRDSRVKERKKYGQKGARKRFQYSKR